MMKKAGVILACFLLMAASASAEHKLLVTEILDAGQVEGQAGFEYLHVDMDADLGAHGEEEVTVNAQETRFSLGVGLGHDVEVYASIPYVIFEKEKAGHEEHEVDGLGDLTVGAKYRPFTEEEMPFTLAVGLDVKFDSAPNDGAGTETTDISPYVAASKEVAEHVEGYAVYRAVLTNHDEPDEHILTLGVEVEINEMLTLDAALLAAYSTSEDEISSFETYGAEVAAYVQVAHNLYLIPAVAIERTTSFEAEEAGVEVDFDPATAYVGALSLYFLY